MASRTLTFASNPWAFLVPPPLSERARASSFEATDIRPLPPPFPQISKTSSTPMPLMPYVAQIVALNAQQTNMDCPITLTAMSDCSTLYVATCGHVCSDVKVKTLKSCPTCRASVAWTTVKM